MLEDTECTPGAPDEALCRYRGSEKPPALLRNLCQDAGTNNFYIAAELEEENLWDYDQRMRNLPGKQLEVFIDPDEIPTPLRAGSTPNGMGPAHQAFIGTDTGDKRMGYSDSGRKSTFSGTLNDLSDTDRNGR